MRTAYKKCYWPFPPLPCRLSSYLNQSVLLQHTHTHTEGYLLLLCCIHVEKYKHLWASLKSTRICWCFCINYWNEILQDIVQRTYWHQLAYIPQNSHVLRNCLLRVRYGIRLGPVLTHSGWVNWELNFGINVQKHSTFVLVSNQSFIPFKISGSSWFFWREEAKIWLHPRYNSNHSTKGSLNKHTNM